MRLMSLLRRTWPAARANRMTSRPVLLLVGFCILLAPPVPSPIASTDITFEERVDAQRAIEAIYYSHLEGARRTFEQAVTRELLERKVRTYLKESAALDDYWNTPVTAEALRQEAARIARDTKYPERLREIETALNHDAVLFQETLVRASLVDRLARSFFAYDKPTHEAARAEAERIRMRLLDGTLDPAADHPRRIIVPAEHELPISTASPGQPFSSSRHETMPLQGIRETPEEVIRPTPTATDAIGPVEESAGHFSIRASGPESSSPGVIYRVPKTTWDEWWAAHQTSLDESGIAAVAEATAMDDFATSALDASCPADDTWDNGALDDRPDGRYGHAAVWTGTEMIVWSGSTLFTSASGAYPTANAGRYDPLTDTWRGISLLGAPELLSGSTAVWTGTEMIVWGRRLLGPRAGGRYDPISDTWRTITTVNEPLTRIGHSAIWTGTEMIIWGGVAFLSNGLGSFTSAGARYDPQSDTWRPTSSIGAPTPRRDHTAVWTGTVMIVWGGELEDLSHLQSGARYDPFTDSWSETSLVNAPSPRKEHTAVYSGTEMIVWGGLTVDFLNPTATGGRYDPIGDSWSTITSAAAPAARRGHTAVWTGSRMIVWGGSRHSNPITSIFEVSVVSGGGAYDPSLDHWQALSVTNAPFSVAYHSAVWTGSLMVVWGGTRGAGDTMPRGGRYDPSNDSWTPTSMGFSGANPSGSGRAVWTGTEMLVWGFGGGRYDLLIDSWRGISTVDAPTDQRLRHAAVWTGDEMMIVGGGVLSGPSVRLPAGRYDPITDTWHSVSTVDSPDVRSGATAVWTGREVLVWGGRSSSAPSSVIPGTGGRYDPSTDTWRLLPHRIAPYRPGITSCDVDVSDCDVNAPFAIEGHTAVWTGAEMIIFGGDLSFQPATVYGARYSPDLDLWAPLPGMTNAQASAGHSAVWTGTQMLVLGGGGSGIPIGPFPWFYDLASDNFSFISTPNPADLTVRRSGHSAVWTGHRMLVWGGSEEPGVIYDREADSWSAMSSQGEPLRRFDPQALWTGKFMLVWGGTHSFDSLASGGRYRFGQNTDDDGDLISECEGDCDDADPGAWPGAPETCNGRDDSCDGVIDEDPNGFDSDGDASPNACDVCPQFPNPGQSDPLACMTADQDGGECLETGIVLAAPLQDGVVSVIREVEVPPDVIHLDFMVLSCATATPIEVLLNERPLIVFADPDPDPFCDCSTPFYRVTVSDRERIRELWNVGGDNALRVRKAAFDNGTFNGTVFGWVRAQIGSGTQQDSETICLFDARQANCTREICTADPGWFTFSAVDVSRSVEVHPTTDEQLVSARFIDSALPRSMDIGHLPDGPQRLCIGSSETPRLFAADTNGNLHMVSEVTGAATPYGSLDSDVLELAHDELSRRTIAQTTMQDVRSLREIEIAGLRSLEVLPYMGRSFSGMEFLNRRLYGVAPTDSGALVIEIFPESGFSRRLGFIGGECDGLASEGGFLYIARTLGGVAEFWAFDTTRGVSISPHTLEFMPSALEFGPDGSLYATRDAGSDTELYRLDTSTGVATLVGAMGIRDVVSLVTVRNHPQACIDFVKQGEQTLAINGSCNAPPSASAGADRTEECSSFAGATVSLDASESADADSSSGTNDDIVLFEWLEHFGTPEEALLGAGESLQIPLALGLHHVTLRVTDAAGERTVDEIAIEVRDTHPPMIAAGLISDNNHFATSRRSGHHGDDDDDGGHHGDDDDDGGHHGDDDDDGGHHGDDDDNGGRFIALFSASDACDPNPSTVGSFMTGVCGAHPAANAQPVLFERDDTCEIETDDGMLQIEAPSLSLHVIATDGTGNQTSADVLPGESHTLLRTDRGRPGTTRNRTVDQTPTTIETP